MSRIVWLPEALQDISRLRLFLEENSSSVAAWVASTLIGGTHRLRDFPELARPLNDGTVRRELYLPFGSEAYVLRYLIDGKTVAIIRVWLSRENRD